MMREVTKKRTVALIFVISVLICFLIVLMPHSHDCIEVDCTVCALTEITRDTIGGLALSAAVYLLVVAVSIILNLRSYISSERDFTPVGLKVKLSD